MGARTGTYPEELTEVVSLDNDDTILIVRGNNIFTASASILATGVENVLTSDSETNALSAAQGKALNTALSSKAALVSPAFTGNPTAPTAAAETDNTEIATTAFVHEITDPIALSLTLAATAAKYYDTIALGLADVADTVTFGVKAGGTDGLTRPTIYRRDSVSTYTLIMDQIAGTELPITPVSVDGIIPFVQDSDGRILLGQYLDGTPFPAEVDVEGRARITVVESVTASIEPVTASIAPVPVSVDGIIPIAQDADGRILLGQYLDGTPFPAEVDIAGRARITEVESITAPVPVSVDGIIPMVQDADGRILLGQYLDGTPYPVEVDIDARARLTIAEARLTIAEATLVSVATLVTPLPVSVDGIIPFVQDADDRILSGIYLDGTPYPAIVIPATNTAYDTILPADPRLLVSDYRTIVERSPQKLSFIRSITEAYNFKYCSPGTRVGFNTNSLSVKINVFYNFLVTPSAARNYVGVVLADGVEVATFTNPSTNTASATVETLVTFGSVATRKIEIIWPYGDGMELVNVKVVSGSTVTIASARPTNKLLLLGDSITHGFYASKVTASWAYLLCGLKSVQMISEGYGSLRTVGSYGTSSATGSGAYAVTVALGYNDFGAQTALATFQTAYQLILTNIRAALPSAKIYVITPIYSTSTNTIPLSDYRTYIGNAVTAVGDGNTVLIDGLTLMTNNSNRLLDGIHPNDTGSAEIAAALAAIIT